MRDDDEIDRDSRRYLDSQYDQRQFEEYLTRRKEELYEAILDHNELAARWTLGVPSANPSTAAATAGDPLISLEASYWGDKRGPAVREQFSLLKAQLLDVLRYGIPRFPERVPRNVGDAWADALDLVSLDRPADATTTLDRLANECHRLAETEEQKGIPLDCTLDLTEIWLRLLEMSRLAFREEISRDWPDHSQ